jgi:RNA polymerase sigma-70 factor (ECF subfamily)
MIEWPGSQSTFYYLQTCRPQGRHLAIPLLTFPARLKSAAFKKIITPFQLSPHVPLCNMKATLIHDAQIQTALVENARNGDEAAIEQLYRQYAKGMYSICTRMCRDAEQAKDIHQDAFINAFKNIRQLKENTQFGAWLKRIVINECIKQLKKINYHYDITENVLEKSDEHTDWLSGLDMKTVQQEIKNLPEGCRQVFVLVAVEDYQHKEVAELLGISESTSKSQYQRARKLLKAKLLTYL